MFEKLLVTISEKNALSKDYFVPEGFTNSRYELAIKIVDEAKYYIEHGEGGVGLEVTLDNLYEIGFVLNQTILELIRETVILYGFNWGDWKDLEELLP